MVKAAIGCAASRILSSHEKKQLKELSQFNDEWIENLWEECSKDFKKKVKSKEKYREVSYFDCYTEKWANHLGELVSGRKSMERIDV